MAVTQFDRDALAKWYARQHLKVDDAIREIYYLPTNAPEREIRLVEVNQGIIEQVDQALEPLDFGVDVGAENSHQLIVLDVTPAQWDRIERRELMLPPDWHLDGAVKVAGQ